MSLLMGARGAGSLIGPLLGTRWAGDSHARLRRGILGGFLFAAAGYVLLGRASWQPIAVLAVIVAHAGSSTNWVFSTTLLQIYTGDRFRGRVFAADLGLCMLTLSASSYLVGLAIDWGTPPRTIATLMGATMLVPAVAWAAALIVTKGRQGIESGGAAPSS
jgi:hypothetical protein